MDSTLKIEKSNFESILKEESNMLPIANYKEEIVEAVKNHSVVIITAETGSGKSTQIPQYLDDYYSEVVVTEPRIMAAKTLAKRVAEERGTTLGEKVGYLTGYDKCYSNNSHILYCTDGLQLIRTIFSENNTTENVLIIDEVHEWNLNIELLVAYCKFMQKKWNTKVIIMSATLETKNLTNFFGKDVAVLSIPGSSYDVSFEERPRFDFIDTIKENIYDRSNVLVFVAGKKEIAEVMEELKNTDATVLPLHGEMDWEEQKKCFEQYPNSKVVVATNVAQTSITIPDIDVVVDTGEAKMTITENGIQGLVLKDISQSDIKQRKGRAGRTKVGKYFLCSDVPMKYRNEYTIPEIQRSSLDRIVLQTAVIGLDAEELQFYHQPEKEAILKAKKELTILGAISSDNHVTEIGHKVVKIPVSVQFARMIVEAEKYGVTEQVIIIASIIEMGGLLTNEGHYSDFTTEKESDLLAELDVWNYLQKMEYIDFKRLGIKKKSFFKIKEHIKKMHESLYGIVKMEHNDDRNAIVKACVSGLVSGIYVKDYDRYYNIDETEFQLGRNSCLPSNSKIIVGIPKKIEFQDYYGRTNSLNLVNFASQIDIDTLIELVPNCIKEITEKRYSVSQEAVEVTTKRMFGEILVDTKRSYFSTHPEYDKLKAQYEEEQKDGSNLSAKKQEVVVIDGKQFEIHQGVFDEKATVDIDNETLFTTDVKEVFLDSGKRVYFSSEVLWNRKETNIVALRNAVEMYRLNNIKSRKMNECQSVVIKNLEDVTKNLGKIGKIEIAKNNGGYGDIPIFVYGYISLKKNETSLKITDDEQLAEAETQEALRYLFYKEIENKYGESKFSHQVGKKKKILTESEMEAKKDFDSLVREITNTITLENLAENLEFVQEYYQELME